MLFNGSGGSVNALLQQDTLFVLKMPVLGPLHHQLKLTFYD